MMSNLHRIESGVYATPDGRFAIIRLDSVGERDTVTTEGWAIVLGDAYDGEELPTIYRTKRDATAALPAVAAKHERRLAQEAEDAARRARAEAHAAAHPVSAEERAHLDAILTDLGFNR